MSNVSIPEAEHDSAAVSFFNSWLDMTDKYMSTLDDDGTQSYTANKDSDNDVIITWRSPRSIKHKGKHCRTNYLSLTLYNPCYTSDKIVFEVELETHIPSKTSHVKSSAIKFRLPVNDNMRKSVMMTKVLLMLSSVIGKNKLEPHVCDTVVSIFDSIEAGKLQLPTKLQERVQC